MKRFSISALFALILLGTVILLAHVAYAQQTEKPGETTYEQAYVPCGYADTKDSKGNSVTRTVRGPDGNDIEIPGDGIVDNPCQFTHIIVFAQKLITGWIIFGVIMATMGFAYAGFLYITAMGSSEKVSHAHSIFIKTFWGFVFMLSAWLIAYTMEQIFLTPEVLKNSFLQERTS